MILVFISSNAIIFISSNAIIFISSNAIIFNSSNPVQSNCSHAAPYDIICNSSHSSRVTPIPN